MDKILDHHGIDRIALGDGRDLAQQGAGANNFFDGLLLDDRTVRNKLAVREQAESAGTFDLLAAIGRDCVGTLRFIPEGLDPGDPARMVSRPVSDEEIAGRLAALGMTPLGLHGDADEFRISIAGVQEKTSLLRMDGRWHLPLGPTPTSHILKLAIKEGPSGAGLSDSPWNERLCLTLCRALGLEAANAEVLLFGDKPVLVVERFDRFWRDGVLYWLPQEDICQALGIPPTRKYQSDGGPGIFDVLDLLDGAAEPQVDRMCFMKEQVLFWLLAADDDHAKNFSLFLIPSGFKLTPLYNLMSAAPYAVLSMHKVKLAMSVGDRRHYRLREIQHDTSTRQVTRQGCVSRMWMRSFRV